MANEAAELVLYGIEGLRIGFGFSLRATGSMGKCTGVIKI